MSEIYSFPHLLSTDTVRYTVSTFTRCRGGLSRNRRSKDRNNYNMGRYRPALRTENSLSGHNRGLCQPTRMVKKATDNICVVTGHNLNNQAANRIAEARHSIGVPKGLNDYYCLK